MAKVFRSAILDRSENFKAEILATKKLEAAFKKDDDTVIYLRPGVRYSPLLGRTIEPDIVVFKKGIGTVIFEVKAWDGNLLRKCRVEKGFLQCGDKKFIPPLVELKAFINALLDKAGPPIGGLLFFPFLSIKDYKALPLSIRELIPEELTVFEDDFLKAKKEMIRRKFFAVLAPFTNRIPEEEIKKNQEKLKRILFPDVNIPNVEASLDEMQESFLFSLKKGYRVVRGGPGSGKTVTLIGKAIQSVLEDILENRQRKIVFLTFGKSLVEKVKSDIRYLLSQHGLEEYEDRIEVYTLHAYAGKIFNAIHPNKKVEDTLEAILNEEIPEEFKPDILLVDETQDLKLEWFQFIKKLYKEEETILAFGVDETQRIYPDTEWKWKDTPFPVTGKKVKVLDKIYRTPAKFIRLGIEFLKKDPKLIKDLKELRKEQGSNWIDSFEARDIKCKVKLYSPKEPYLFVRKLVKDLLTRYKPDEILILTPHDDKRLKRFLQKEFGKVNENSHFERGKINVITYYRSKGLEAEAVIILEFDKLFNLKLRDNVSENRRLRRLGFVALTRAKKELFILGKEEGAFNEVKEILNEIDF